MNQNEPRVTWDDNGWAVSDGWELAHCTNTVTGEYTETCDVWVSAGTGLPAGAYLEVPPAPEPGMAIVRTGEGWSRQVDHRGEMAYHKQTKAQTVITEIGDLPATLTLLAPQSQFDVWDELPAAWVKDATAEQLSMTTQAKQQKAALMFEAASMISTLQDAVDIGMATPAEEAALLDWKRYRVTLTRLDVAVHPISWPAPPATA